MKFSTVFTTSVALAVAPHTSAAPTACKEKVASYDGPISNYNPGSFNANGLHYEGFSVVPASKKGTFFQPHSSPNMLAIKRGTHGVIRPIHRTTGDMQNSTFFPGTFYVGCASAGTNGAAAKPVDCSASFATPVIGYGGPETVSFALDKGDYDGRKLRAGDWGGPVTPYINVTVYDGPHDAIMYLDSLQFTENCTPQ